MNKILLFNKNQAGYVYPKIKNGIKNRNRTFESIRNIGVQKNNFVQLKQFTILTNSINTEKLLKRS
jgi:hypothetical protein